MQKLLFSVILVLLGAVGMTGCDQAENQLTADALVENASQRIETGDVKEAIRLLEKASAKGEPDAQVQLANIYEYGFVHNADNSVAGRVPRDLNRSRALMEEAQQAYHQQAESGDLEAQTKLGNILVSEGRKNEGLSLLEDAAEKEYPEALASYGFQKYWGREEAIPYLTRAAELGDPQGQFMLAVAYEKGLGVEQDAAKRQFWLQKAADQGHRLAIRGLSSMQGR